MNRQERRWQKKKEKGTRNAFDKAEGEFKEEQSLLRSLSISRPFPRMGYINWDLGEAEKEYFKNPYRWENEYLEHEKRKKEFMENLIEHVSIVSGGKLQTCSCMSNFSGVSFDPKNYTKDECRCGKKE